MYRFLIIGLLFIAGCATHPKEVDKAIELASDNKSEIIEAIRYYQKALQDTQKLKALYFLLTNMPGKGYLDYDLIPSRSMDPKGKAAKNKNLLDVLGLCRIYQHATSDSLFHIAKDSLLYHTGFSYSFKKKEPKSDLQDITKKMLIEHIDTAFDIWNSSLWKNKISYDDFCQYILPYRIDREPLQVWLPNIRKQAVKMLADSGLSSCSDPERIIHAIDNYLKKHYGYNRARTHFFPRQLDIEEVTLLRGGTCEDLTTIAGYWLRAVGIPVSPIKIPIWSHMNAGHTMLAVIWGPKEIQAFNPFEKGDVIKYETFDTPRSITPKIFLSSFVRSANTDNDMVLSRLYGQNLIDVTQIVSSKVSDVTVRTEKFDNRSNYYLAVSNGQDWQPVQKGLVIEDMKIVFPKMTEGILYLPISIDKDGKKHPFSDPLIKIDGKQKIFGSGSSNAQKYTFKTKMGWGIKKPGDMVKIFRWENNSSWNLYSNVQANDRLELTVTAETGALYFYKIIGSSGLVDRPFSVNADSIMVY